MKSLPQFLRLAALLFAACLSTVPALGSPAGELDPAFGDHGRVLLRDSEFGEFRGVEVFVEPGSGKLLAVATGWYDNVLLRFNSDGSLDPAFGHQGAVHLDFGGDQLDILDVERLGDDRLLIAGVLNAFGDSSNVLHGDALLARMHADGTPDETFGDGGRAIFRLGGVYESVSEILLQADGRIVALGSTNRSGRVERILARYTKDGVPDAGFGNGVTPGISVIGFAGTLAAVVQQGDGKFMACGNGTSSREVLAVRILADGAPDSAFGINGTAAIGGWQQSIEIDDCLELADGHLVVAGSSGTHTRQRAAALRLTPDGRLDAAFGSNGIVVLDTDLPSDASAMLVMSDGSLAIAGSYWKPGNGTAEWTDLLVARIDPVSGAIDRGFGDRGVTTVDLGSGGFPGVAEPAGLRQQPDGKLVIVGSQVDRGDWYDHFSIAIARIDPYGSGSNGWAGMSTTFALVPREPATVALNLRRTGGGTGELSVSYRTVDGTATAGLDYAASSGTVTWAEGDLSDKAVTVQVLASEPTEDYRWFHIELFDSSGGLALNQATVDIRPSVSYSPPPGSPPSGRGGYSGGGAIGIELWLLAALAAFGLARRTR